MENNTNTERVLLDILDSLDFFNYIEKDFHPKNESYYERLEMNGIDGGDIVKVSPADEIE